MWIGACSNKLLKILTCLTFIHTTEPYTLGCWNHSIFFTCALSFLASVPLQILCFQPEMPFYPSFEFPNLPIFKHHHCQDSQILAANELLAHWPSVAFLSLPLLGLTTFEPVLCPWSGTSGRGRLPSDSTLNLPQHFVLPHVPGQASLCQ